MITVLETVYDSLSSSKCLMCCRKILMYWLAFIFVDKMFLSRLDLTSFVVSVVNPSPSYYLTSSSYTAFPYLSISRVSTKWATLPSEVATWRRWNIVLLSTRCLFAYVRFSRTWSIHAAPIAALVFFFQTFHLMESPANIGICCLWSFTLERLRNSFFLLDVLPMLSMLAMGLINNNRLMSILVGYIIWMIEDINIVGQSHCLIYKILSSKIQYWIYISCVAMYD